MAANYWVQYVLRQLYKGVVSETTFDFATETLPTIAAMPAVATAIYSQHVLSYNNMQVSDTNNLGYKFWWRGGSGVSVEGVLTGGGGHSPSDVEFAQPDHCLYWRKSVDLTQKWSDGSTVVSRVIKRGGLFSVGASYDWVDDGIPTIPAGLTAAYGEFQDAMTTDLVVSGATYVNVVHGFALPAGDDLPARDECFAPIASINYRYMSRQRNRTPF